MSMQAEEKVARQRFSVLQLAQVLSNVSAACRAGAAGRSSPEKGLHWLSAMDRRAVPDKEDLATEFAQEDARRTRRKPTTA